MRLSIVSPSAYPMLVPGKVPFAGGAEFQLLLLARAMARRGHEVSFVVGDYGQAERIVVDDFEVHRAFRLFRGNRKLRFIPDMLMLRRALRKSRPEVVNQRSTAFYTGQTCAFAHEVDAAFVFSLGIDYNCFPDLQGRVGWPIPSLYAWGIRHAEMVLAQTREQSARMAQNFGRTQIEVFPNMMELPPDRVPEGDRDYALWVGSLARRKRPELFLEAARRLPDYRFRLVGGPGEDIGFDAEIRAKAAEIPNVELVGFVPPNEIDREFAGAAVYVNTSSLEGLPNTFLQSWAMSVPTLTVSVDPDGVIQRECLGGVVGEGGDLGAALGELMSDPGRLRESGRRARRHVEKNHDSQRLGDVAEELLRTAILRRGSGGQGSRK